ncbi:MAG TPA: amidase family protein, partial [Actinomycetota bacterium]|nr:amidase family protein [Actinomycetota bacterium]
MTELWERTAADLASLIASKDVSAAEVAESCIARTNEVEGDVLSYLTLTPDAARAKAAEVDAAVAAGEPLGPLAGVPMALKDIICTQGIRSTAASKILDTYVPPYSA